MVPVIVLFIPLATQVDKQRAIAAVGGQIIREYKILNAVAALVPSVSVNQLTALSQPQLILSVDPDLPTVANDLSADQQIRASQVWTSGYLGAGVRLAILDSGIDTGHPEFAGRIVACHTEVSGTTTCEDDNGHGTHVAGIAAAQGLVSSAKGVAPAALLMSDKVLDSTGHGSFSQIIAGIDWAVSNGAQVISISIGSLSAADNGGTLPNCDSWMPSLTTAINNAVSAGVTVVNSAGNLGTQGLTAPGCVSGVIAVGAVDSSDTLASFSSVGAAMSDHGVAAPGVSIYSTYLGNGYATDSGTSMAAPMVSGTIALLLSKNPGLRPNEVRNMIFSTANCVSGYCPNTQIGHGRIDSLSAANTVLHATTDKTTYAQGEYIQFTGTGFTPSGPISSCISTGNVAGAGVCMSQPNADGQGNVGGSMQVGTNIPPGPQKFWVVDISTGRDSNAVQLTISNSPPTISSWTPDKASPQVVGATIVWTCSASDPEGDPILYRFWMRKGSGAWAIVQDWSSSNTFAWAPSQAGDYQFIVWVRDQYHAGPSGQDDWSFWNLGGGKSQAAGSYFTIQANQPPVITGFSADKSSPQSAGTTITFTASASDPDAGDSILYRFWMRKGSGAWAIVQDWSSSNTFAWTPTQTGDYQFIVWIRDGHHADATGQDDWSFWVVSGGKSQSSGSTFTIQGAPYSVTFQESGIPGGVTWGVTVGGSRRTSSSSSQTVSGLSGSVGYVYDSSVPVSGGAYVCQSGCSGSVSGAGTVTATYTFTVVQLGPPVVSGFSADKVSPQTVGTVITFTCSATDPDVGDTILYRFWVYSGDSWVIVQDWSSSNTFVWTPSAAGSFQFIVWVRDGYHAGASAQDDWSFWTANGSPSKVAGSSFTIQASSNLPPVISGFSADKASPQGLPVTVTFTCSASDPDVGDTIQYRFYVKAGGSWVVVQDWSSSNTYAWTPSAAGSYQFIVWVRDGYHAGASAQDDWSYWTANGSPSKVAGSSFTIQASINNPPVISGFSANKVSPQPTGTTVTFTCSATDPDAGDQILYRFWMRKGSGAWAIVRDWSSSNTYAWAPTQAGDYQFIVWIRDGYNAGATGQDDWSFWTLSGLKSQTAGSTFRIQ